MKGYKITYIELDGSTSSIFYGEPVTNMKMDVVSIIQLMFFNSHPGCVLLHCEPCSLDKYYKEEML